MLSKSVQMDLAVRSTGHNVLTATPGAVFTTVAKAARSQLGPLDVDRVETQGIHSLSVKASEKHQTPLKTGAAIQKSTADFLIPCSG
jgi:hypothetical protein